MILYPAIDLKDGACVRLVRGDMTAVTLYNTDPSEQAKKFAQSGFRWLHLVDLNGAVAGHPVNGPAVETILSSVDLPIQLGGGIRTIETVAYWIERGISRVIIGTAAVKNPVMVKEACRLFPGQIAVGIDARAGLVAVEGWTETSEMRALDLALRLEDVGVAAIIYTDIDRDGALQGVNVDATVDLAFALTTPVIASGGVTSMADLEALKAEEASGIEGVICGRALYDGRIDPAEALRLLDGPAAA